MLWTKEILWDLNIRHYDDVIMTMLASQITSLTVVYSIVYSGVNQRKHQSSASLVFVREIHRRPVNFPHKWPVTRKMFPFDDVIMISFAVISHIARAPAQSSSKLSWLEWREMVPAIRTRAPSQYKDRLSRYGISIIMINPILVRRCPHIEKALRWQGPF